MVDSASNSNASGCGFSFSEIGWCFIVCFLANFFGVGAKAFLVTVIIIALIVIIGRIVSQVRSIVP